MRISNLFDKCYFSIVLKPMKIIYRCFSNLEVLHFNFIFSQDNRQDKTIFYWHKW